MTTETENNNGLYFLVGILLTMVVLGFFYFANTPDNNTAPNVIERTVERTIEKDSADKGSSFELNVDDNGFSASTTNNE